jgi:hypothetical protein
MNDNPHQSIVNTLLLQTPNSTTGSPYLKNGGDSCSRVIANTNQRNGPVPYGPLTICLSIHELSNLQTPTNVWLVLESDQIQAEKPRCQCVSIIE